MIETIFIIFLLCIILLFKYLYWNEVCYVESFDSNNYLVRNLPDKDKAALMLAEIRNKLINFVDNLASQAEKESMVQEDDKEIDSELIDNYKYIKMIQKKLPNSIIKESSAKSEFTSYSVNKGEELVFCLRSKKNNKLHDINDLMYVAVHEIAHIGCPEIGHTPLFKNINKFLLERAALANLYKFENYKATQKEYCGITLTSNILEGTKFALA
jgi:predicted metal-dependent hydrolase